MRSVKVTRVADRNSTYDMSAKRTFVSDSTAVIVSIAASAVSGELAGHNDSVRTCEHVGGVTVIVVCCCNSRIFGILVKSINVSSYAEGGGVADTYVILVHIDLNNVE